MGRLQQALERGVDLIAMAVGVAAIVMLLRPSSKGPQIVSSFMSAYIDAIAGAEGATITPNTPATSALTGPGAAAAAGFSESASGPTQFPIGTTFVPGFPGPEGPPNPSIQQRLRNALNL